jgi:hypothetical protein
MDLDPGLCAGIDSALNQGATCRPRLKNGMTADLNDLNAR